MHNLNLSLDKVMFMGNMLNGPLKFMTSPYPKAFSMSVFIMNFLVLKLWQVIFQIVIKCINQMVFGLPFKNIHQ